MRCILEDRFRSEEYRQIIIGRACQCDFSARALNIESAAHGGVEAHEAFARAEAARAAEMTLNEFWLLLHVLRHVTPAIFLHDGGEGEESGVVIRRIGADDFS